MKTKIKKLDFFTVIALPAWVVAITHETHLPALWNLFLNFFRSVTRLFVLFCGFFFNSFVSVAELCISCWSRCVGGYGHMTDLYPVR